MSFSAPPSLQMNSEWKVCEIFDWPLSCSFSVRHIDVLIFSGYWKNFDDDNVWENLRCTQTFQLKKSPFKLFFCLSFRVLFGQIVCTPAITPEQLSVRMVRYGCYVSGRLLERTSVSSKTRKFLKDSEHFVEPWKLFRGSHRTIYITRVILYTKSLIFRVQAEEDVAVSQWYYP